MRTPPSRRVLAACLTVLMLALGLPRGAMAQDAHADPALEAEEALLAAVRRTELDGDAAALAATLRNLAVFYETRGRVSEARSLHERALTVRRRALGRTHIDVVQSLDDLALLESRAGRLGRAARLYRQALHARERLYGRDHLSTGIGLNNLARLYAQDGRSARAVRLYLRELALLEQAYGAQSVRLISTLETLAGLHAGRGRAAEAEAAYRRAIRIAEAGDAPATERRLLGLLEGYAGLLRRIGSREAEAVALDERALALRARNPGIDRRAAPD